MPSTGHRTIYVIAAMRWVDISLGLGTWDSSIKDTEISLIKDRKIEGSDSQKGRYSPLLRYRGFNVQIEGR